MFPPLDLQSRHAFASKLRIDRVILNSQAQQQDAPCERHGSRPWCDDPSLDPTRVGCTIPFTVHWHIIPLYIYIYITACHVVASHLRLDRWCTVGLLPQSVRTPNYQNVRSATAEGKTFHVFKKLLNDSSKIHGFGSKFATKRSMSTSQ